MKKFIVSSKPFVEVHKIVDKFIVKNKNHKNVLNITPMVLFSIRFTVEQWKTLTNTQKHVLRKYANWGYSLELDWDDDVRKARKKWTVTKGYWKYGNHPAVYVFHYVFDDCYTMILFSPLPSQSVSINIFNDHIHPFLIANANKKEKDKVK